MSEENSSHFRSGVIGSNVVRLSHTSRSGAEMDHGDQDHSLLDVSNLDPQGLAHARRALARAREMLNFSPRMRDTLMEMGGGNEVQDALTAVEASLVAAERVQTFSEAYIRSVEAYQDHARTHAENTIAMLESRRREHEVASRAADEAAREREERALRLSRDIDGLMAQIRNLQTQRDRLNRDVSDARTALAQQEERSQSRLDAARTRTQEAERLELVMRTKLRDMIEQAERLPMELAEGEARLATIASEETRLSDLLTSNRYELDRLRRDLTNLERQYEDRRQQAEQDFTARREQLERGFSDRMAALDADYESRRDQLDSDIAQRIETLEESYSTRSHSLEADLSQRTEALEADYASRAAALNSEHTARIKALEGEYAGRNLALEADYVAKTESLEADFQTRAQSLEAAYAQRVQKTQDEYATLSTSLQATYAHQREHLEAERLSIEGKLREYEMFADEKIGRIKTELSRLEADLDETNQRLSDLIQQEADAQRALDTLRAEHQVTEQSLVECTTALDAERAALADATQKLQQTQADYQSTEEKLAETRAALLQVEGELAETRELAERVRTDQQTEQQALESQTTTLRNALAEAEARFSQQSADLQQQITALESDRQTLIERCERLDMDSQTQQAHLEDLHHRCRQAENELAGARELEHQVREEIDRLRSEARMGIEEARQTLMDMENEAYAMEKRRDSLIAEEADAAATLRSRRTELDSMILQAQEARELIEHQRVRAEVKLQEVLAARLQAQEAAAAARRELEMLRQRSAEIVSDAEEQAARLVKDAQTLAERQKSSSRLNNRFSGGASSAWDALNRLDKTTVSAE